MSNNIIFYLYLIDAFSALEILLESATIIGGVLLFVLVCFHVSLINEGSFADNSLRKSTHSIVKKLSIALGVVIALLILTPKKEFMHIALGIKGIEHIIDSEGFREISDKTLELVNKKLDDELGDK